MIDVIRPHREAMRGLQPDRMQPELFLAAPGIVDNVTLAKSTATRIRR